MSTASEVKLVERFKPIVATYEKTLDTMVEATEGMLELKARELVLLVMREDLTEVDKDKLVALLGLACIRLAEILEHYR